MKFLLIADIHLSDKPPSSCTDSYTDDLFDLLHQAQVVGRERGVDAMVWAGDTFHCKAPGRVSHRLVQRVCSYIGECPSRYGFPVLILAGNHDMANDRLESVMESQPLGVLYRAGAVELNGWASGWPVYGVPWLPSYGDYTEASDSDVGMVFGAYRERVFDQGTGNQIPLVVAHAPLYPPGKELPYEYFPTDRWAEAMGMHRGGHHRVFYGHVHESHGTYGIYDAGGDVTFCNNGALSRGSLHEYNLTRQVGVTVYDTETGKFEFVPLRAKPAGEVFRLQEKAQATDLAGRLDDFLDGIGGTSLEVMSAESVIAHIRSLGVGKEVEDLAAELVEEAQHAEGK